MTSWFSYLLELLRNLGAPAHCVYCLTILSERVPLCESCVAQIRPVASIDLVITERLSVPVIALGAYEPPLSTLILAKQYRQHVSAHQLGWLLAKHLREYTVSADCIIPVPLHWKRYAQRGFNQAEIIAHDLHSVLNIPVVPLVTRHRHTAFQMGYDLKERTDNVAKAFTLNKNCNPQFYQGKRFILVDDVLTTGSTIKAIITTLLPLQPASIQVIVAARVV